MINSVKEFFIAKMKKDSTFREIVYRKASENLFYLGEDRVRNYVVDLHDHILKKGVPEHESKNYSCVEFNKNRLDTIRGVTAVDGEEKSIRLKGTQDTKMLYGKGDNLKEITDTDTFVKIVKNTYEKMYSPNQEELRIVENSARKYFENLKSDIMNNPREEPKFGICKNTDYNF